MFEGSPSDHQINDMYLRFMDKNIVFLMNFLNIRLPQDLNRWMVSQ